MTHYNTLCQLIAFFLMSHAIQPTCMLIRLLYVFYLVYRASPPCRPSWCHMLLVPTATPTTPSSGVAMRKVRIILVKLSVNPSIVEASRLDILFWQILTLNLSWINIHFLPITIGQIVCNACGLYFKLHGVNRPSHLFRLAPMTRRRNPKKKKDASVPCIPVTTTAGLPHDSFDSAISGNVLSFFFIAFNLFIHG